MARAKLHIICGNCGSNEHLSFAVDPTGHDVTVTEPKFAAAVYVRCGNCLTLHNLRDTIPENTSEIEPIKGGRE